MQLAKRYVNAHALVDLSVSVVLEPLRSNGMSANKQKVVNACIVVSTPMVIEKGVSAVSLHMLSKHTIICRCGCLMKSFRRLTAQIDLSDILAKYILDLQSVFCFTACLQNCVSCCGLV